MKQNQTPLYTALKQFKSEDPYSMHVPGHKNGSVFPKKAETIFKDILSIDLTEITGLDDLHQPEGVIEDAQQLASQWFASKETFFLVGGSTAGNLAMIVAAHQKGRPFLVQRNSHKSVMHALELSGSQPVFLDPAYNDEYKRYTSICYTDVEKALEQFPHASGLILTYPDYFGHAIDLKPIIELAHSYDVPVLVDEAHGVHLSLGHPSMPRSSLSLGADIVVQSAHKMAPAMTMGAYLHTSSYRVDADRIRYYLQLFQSSSPSYPIMASLDLARYYLANMTSTELNESLNWIEHLRKELGKSHLWSIVPVHPTFDDPFKITLHVSDGYQATDVAETLERVGIYPELVTGQQILLIAGLSPFVTASALLARFKQAEEKLQAKGENRHATIEEVHWYGDAIQVNPYSFHELEDMSNEFVDWSDAEGRIARYSVIPYPPGIPLLMKGERIQKQHVGVIQSLLNSKHHIQTIESFIHEGIHVYRER